MLRITRLAYSVKPSSLGASLLNVCLFGTFCLGHFVRIDNVHNGLRPHKGYTLGLHKDKNVRMGVYNDL